MVGVVPEDSFLFSDTVLANISYGRPDATEDEITAAARAAQADGFIRELPDGYDDRRRRAGPDPLRRPAPADRAGPRDPRRPADPAAGRLTSAVDPRIEAEIHEALRTVMAGRTTLLIAHRRSTLLLADRIAVLEHGRLVDLGTHEELRAPMSPVPVR